MSEIEKKIIELEEERFYLFRILDRLYEQENQKKIEITIITNQLKILK